MLTPTTIPETVAHDVLARIVVGVDGTEPGYEACRQAATLAEADSTLEAVSAVHTAPAVAAGWSALRIAEELEREAAEAIAQARWLLGPKATTRILEGAASGALLKELHDTGATLVALGTHGHSRASEILLGGVAGELLHSAPCSVLIARPPGVEGSFPGSIVAGADGSPCSAVAVAVARKLSDRFDAPLRIVTALDDEPDLDALPDDAELLDVKPVWGLMDASVAADLVVVGCRGIHGLRALGSVSERVAHRAASSVLVVKGPIGG